MLIFCKLLLELGISISMQVNNRKLQANQSILNNYSPCIFNKAKPNEIPKRVIAEQVYAVVKISSIIYFYLYH